MGKNVAKKYKIIKYHLKVAKKSKKPKKVIRKILAKVHKARRHFVALKKKAKKLKGYLTKSSITTSSTQTVSSTSEITSSNAVTVVTTQIVQVVTVVKYVTTIVETTITEQENRLHRIDIQISSTAKRLKAATSKGNKKLAVKL